MAVVAVSRRRRRRFTIGNAPLPAGIQMRAAALAAAVIAGFFGVMYLRFSGDTVPAPPTPRPYAAGQPTCIAFRPVSSEHDSGPATCGAVRAVFQPSPWSPPAPVRPATIHSTKQGPFARVVNTEGT